MDPFAHELYNLITIKKKINPQDLARKIGVTMDTIYRYDRDDVKTPLFRARQIVAVTREIELARAMLEGTGFLPVEIPEAGIGIERINTDQINIFLATAEAIKTIQESLEDNELSPAEVHVVDKALDNLMIKIEGLRLKLKAYKK